MAFSRNGKQILGITGNSQLEIVDITTGNSKYVSYPEGTNPCCGLALSPDGNVVAIGGTYGGAPYLMDAESGKLSKRLDGHRCDVTSVAFSANGKLLASASCDQKVKLWDVESKKLLRTIENAGDFFSVALSPDAKLVAGGTRDATIKIWDTESGALLRTVKNDVNPIALLAFTPDANTLISESADVVFIDVANGSVVRRLNVEGSVMNAMALSPDGTRLATGGYQDHVVRVWDVASGRELQDFGGHTDTVAALAWSPDGSTLASSSWDKTIRLWEVDGTELAPNTDENAEQKIAKLTPPYKASGKPPITVTTRPELSWRELLNQYQRRAELIPNLVEAAKYYGPHENKVYAEVAEAHAKVSHAELPPDILTNPEAFQTFQEAQDQLSGALGRLLAVAENYPELKSNLNFQALLRQLDGSKNRIAIIRSEYSAAADEYNRLNPSAAPLQILTAKQD